MRIAESWNITLRVGAGALLGCLLSGGGAGCGYTLRTSEHSALEKDGIRKLYVAPLVNNTYRSGVENLIYNSLIRAISAQRGVKLVRTQGEADGLLRGVVTRADFTSGAVKEISQINRPPLPLDKTVNFQKASIASEYVAYLDCSFELARREPRPGQKPVVWTSAFSRSRPFPASNQLGSYGTTSALINDSEFDRTLADLASSMMSDVQESMLARF